MRKIIFTVVFGLAIALTVGGAYYHLAGPILYCFNVYPLTVEIHSANGGIEQVYFEPCKNSAIAEDQLKSATQVSPQWPLTSFGHVEKPIPGQPISVGLPYSSTVYPLGKTRGRYYQTKLLVVAQYRDNRRIGTIVDIPPHDPDLETRTITVRLP
ncbi:MAG: hypothetical protein FJ271_28110 [Planctomycetes bacterium]|nr:hypothetical protein [Planctomycetota bacterium]